MRIAAIYDVHGNLPALEAVLAEVREAGVDLVVIGGDVVPGPMPCESIACLRDLDLPTRFIAGNGEREVLAERAGTGAGGNLPEQVRETIRWNAEQLDDRHARLLSGWPGTVRIETPDLGEVLFCHGTPSSDTEIFTSASPEDPLIATFSEPGVPFVVCGHTHMQFERTIGSVRVVNAGSVGMPFGEPGADWLLLGPGVDLRHTPYDLTRAAERIRATEYPQARTFAENHVLKPPTEEQMLRVFSQP